jgi:hypothetical protein
MECNRANFNFNHRHKTLDVICSLFLADCLKTRRLIVTSVHVRQLPPLSPFFDQLQVFFLTSSSSRRFVLLVVLYNGSYEEYRLLGFNAV